jgi:hypothetical protein
MGDVFNRFAAVPARRSSATNEVQLWWYPIDCLDGYGILLVCPEMHSFCSFPQSRLSCGYGHFLDESAGPWERWLTAKYLSPEVERRFLAELKRHRIPASKVPFGLFPFVGGTSVSPDLGYGRGVQVLPGLRFRCYLVPRSGSDIDGCAGILSAAIDERSSFGIRPVGQPIEQCEGTHFQPEDTRDEALLWSFCAAPADLPFAEKRRAQEIAIQQLEEAICRAESGQPPDFDGLSPCFCELSPRATLAAHSAQTVIHHDDEYITSLRVRLMRLTKWPIFYESVRNLPAETVQRNLKFGPPRRPLPYDIQSNAQDLAADIVLRYPSYVGHIFDRLFT